MYLSIILVFAITLFFIPRKGNLTYGFLLIRRCLLLPYKTLLSEQPNDNDHVGKLPIIKVVGSENLDVEFVIGNNMEIELKKFSYYISAFTRDLNAKAEYKPKLEYVKWPIDNIYTDEKLESILNSREVSVIKFYRNGCRKCVVQLLFYR